jgi:hypothetical protein
VDIEEDDGLAERARQLCNGCEDRTDILGALQTVVGADAVGG